MPSDIEDTTMTDVTTKKKDFDINKIIAADDVDALADFMEQAGWCHGSDSRTADVDLLDDPDDLAVFVEKTSYLGGDHLIEGSVRIPFSAAAGNQSEFHDCNPRWRIDNVDVPDDSELFVYLEDDSPLSFRPETDLSIEEACGLQGLTSPFSQSFVRKELEDWVGDVDDDIILTALRIVVDEDANINQAVEWLSDPFSIKFKEVARQAINDFGGGMTWGRFEELPDSTRRLRSFIKQAQSNT